MHDENDLHEFETAKEAAQGDPVEKIEAAKVRVNMILFHEGEFLQVKYANQLDRSVMIDYYAEQGMTACRVVAPDRTMYRRIPNMHPVAVGAHDTEADQFLAQAIERDGTAPQR